MENPSPVNIEVRVPKAATPSKSPSVDFSFSSDSYAMELCSRNQFDK